MSLRTSRTRDVFSSWPVARWKRKLNCSFFRLSSSSWSWSCDIALMSESLWVDFMACLLADALNEARLDRKLRGPEAQGLAGDVLRNAVDLEHDAARGDAGGPELGRALAFAHAHLGRLLRHRHVREHPDPDAALALHLACDGAPGGLDRARRDALRREPLQAELAEVELRAALRGTADAALELLAELGLL